MKNTESATLTHTHTATQPKAKKTSEYVAYGLWSVHTYNMFGSVYSTQIRFFDFPLNNDSHSTNDNSSSQPTMTMHLPKRLFDSMRPTKRQHIFFLLARSLAQYFTFSLSGVRSLCLFHHVSEMLSRSRTRF